MNNKQLILDFLSKNNLQDLFSNENIELFKIKNYVKDEIIIEADNPIKKLYFIISGNVEIYSFLSSGKSIFINKLSPPEITPTLMPASIRSFMP